MTSSSFEAFLESKLALPTTTSTGKTSELAVGRSRFYDALDKALKKTATKEQIGLLDAVNDTLQQLGLIEQSKSLISYTQ